MGSSFSPSSDVGESRQKLVAELAGVHAKLAVAADEAALLDAVMGHVERFGPQSAELYYVQVSARDRADTVKLVARWREGTIAREDPDYRRPMPLHDVPTAPLWLASPDAPLMLEDPENGHRATAFLPLYSPSSQTWHGVLEINWSQPHQPSEEESCTYLLLSQTLTAFVANRRAQLALH